MLTNAERIMALKCNLKNFDWTVTPQFRLEREDADALLELLTRDSGSELTDEAPEYRRFTVWGKSAAELERASESVYEYMSQRIGRNIISYQIMGESQPQPYDYGFITDEALKELELGFIIVPEVYSAINS